MKTWDDLKAASRTDPFLRGILLADLSGAQTREELLLQAVLIQAASIQRMIDAAMEKSVEMRVKDGRR